MQAVRYHEFGDETVLQYERIDTLEPGTNDVRIEVRSIGVNPCDALRRQGLWGDTLPLIPGSDVAGVVEAVGDNVTRFSPGDRVFGTIPHLNVTGARGDRQGTYADRVVARVDRLARLPDDVGFDAGAGVGLIGITAYRALFHFGGLSPGQRCFVHGGSGGVGHVAVQLAAAAGATVVATAAPSRAEHVHEFGADVVLDYDADDLADAASEAVGPGADVVLDHRLGEYVGLDVELAAKNGTVVAIGGNYDTPQIPDLTAAIGKDLTVQPMDMFNEPNIDVALGRLATLLETGSLDVSVARTYDLADAVEAHRAIENDSFIGKLVLHP